MGWLYQLVPRPAAGDDTCCLSKLEGTVAWLTCHLVSRGQRVYREKFETWHRHSVCANPSIWEGGRWRVLVWFLYIQTHHVLAIKACLYSVFTEWCNQCNCERVFLTEMSVFFLSAWVQVGTCWFSLPVFLISKCKCIFWCVSASVYTPFFIIFVFPGSNTNNNGSILDWDVSSDLCQQLCLSKSSICLYLMHCKEP